jgi:MarR family 2-MHQ and catechol resistance regulon transcriptional repressor
MIYGRMVKWLKHAACARAGRGLTIGPAREGNRCAVEGTATLPDVTSNRNDRPSDPAAARWVELAERIVVCAKVVRADLALETPGLRIGAAEFSLLWVCREAPAGGIGQKELAETLAVSAAQVSGLVERLRRQGLIEGSRAASDRRRQLWRLTPEGHRLLHHVLRDLSAWAERLDARLGADNTSRLTRHLDELLGALRSPHDTLEKPQQNVESPATLPVRGGARRSAAHPGDSRPSGVPRKGVA